MPHSAPQLNPQQYRQSLMQTGQAPLAQAALNRTKSAPAKLGNETYQPVEPAPGRYVKIGAA
jgi:poly(3-hydroxyalkanoate) synthetase